MSDLYRLTENSAYFAQCIKSDIAKGKTLQQAASDVFTCMLMMNRGINAAMQTAAAAVYYSGNRVQDVKW